MIIKMVNEFELTVFHLRAQTRCKSEHARGFTVRQQNCVGLRATGPPGHQAAGPSRAVGRGPLGLRAAGPLGRGGPWAAGLQGFWLPWIPEVFHSLWATKDQSEKLKSEAAKRPVFLAASRLAIPSLCEKFKKPLAS